MRKVIAWPISWALFWIGNWTSVVFLRHDWTFMYAAFRLYQWAMQTSAAVQDWAQTQGPWEVPSDA